MVRLAAGLAGVAVVAGLARGAGLAGLTLAFTGLAGGALVTGLAGLAVAALVTGLACFAGGAFFAGLACFAGGAGLTAGAGFAVFLGAVLPVFGGVAVADFDALAGFAGLTVRLERETDLDVGFFAAMAQRWKCGWWKRPPTNPEKRLAGGRSGVG